MITGDKIVVVLSAMGKFTDELVLLSQEISKNVPKREMDMLFTVRRTNISITYGNGI